MTLTSLPRQRRHILYFQEELRSVAPVFLDTEIDMTNLLAARKAASRHYSVVSYILHAAGHVLAGHPEANSSIRSGLNPAVVRNSVVHGKVTLDKEFDGQRVVLAAVLRDLDTAGMSEIQDGLEYYRDSDASTLPEFAGLRKLHGLPALIGRLVYRRVVRPLRSRADVFGTFAVSSLGHRAVDGFHSLGGTTITLGVGRILDRPVVHEANVVIAPVMRLSLAFDHRVIDGAEAADVLTEIKEHLEGSPGSRRDGPDTTHGLTTLGAESREKTT